ncbi:hypothetical protein AB0B51_33355, partial [Streptomyces griseus]|uniref:hypothetical protein n=1 Tax=Streptomyces griseus TaxID=1911 RepID=UPI0033C2F35D
MARKASARSCDNGPRGGAPGPLQRAARTMLAAEPRPHDAPSRSRTPGLRLVPDLVQVRGAQTALYVHEPPA